MSYRHRLADTINPPDDKHQPDIWQMDWGIRIGYVATVALAAGIPFFAVVVPVTASNPGDGMLIAVMVVWSAVLTFLADSLMAAVAAGLRGELWC